MTIVPGSVQVSRQRDFPEAIFAAQRMQRWLMLKHENNFDARAALVT